MLTAYDNVALWHERDISHSSAERIILQDSTSLVDYMLKRYSHTLSKLIVNEQKVTSNIDITYGVIHTQSVLNLLIKKDIDRERAYEVIQKLAFQALDTHQMFQELLLNDSFIMSVLNQDELASIFLVDSYLKYVDDIYLNVFK
jgi:adenylosuccinate lyase